jgi:anti-sigma B factor antagonist
MVLDFTQVDFLCAAGLPVLVVLSELAQRAGTVLCVVARNRPVRPPLMITGLTGVLDLPLGVDEALACERAGAPASRPEVRSADPRQPGDLR